MGQICCNKEEDKIEELPQPEKMQRTTSNQRKKTKQLDIEIDQNQQEYTFNFHEKSSLTVYFEKNWILGFQIDNRQESDGQKTNIKYTYGNCSDRGDMKKQKIKINEIYNVISHYNVDKTTGHNRIYELIFHTVSKSQHKNQVKIGSTIGVQDFLTFEKGGDLSKRPASLKTYVGVIEGKKCITGQVFEFQ